MSSPRESECPSRFGDATRRSGLRSGKYEDRAVTFGARQLRRFSGVKDQPRYYLVRVRRARLEPGFTADRPRLMDTVRPATPCG
jgi:hypothetical protein